MGIDLCSACIRPTMATYAVNVQMPVLYEEGDILAPALIPASILSG